MSCTIINYISESVFLCENKAIKDFAKNYVQNYDISSSQHWSIVCERREDIINVRNQIFIEIECITGKKLTTLNGFSIYSLDTIAEKICACLANINDEKIKKQIPSSLFKPYVDIIEQEKIIEVILNLFGYNGNDSLTIAKQILTLIDLNFPVQTNLVELLLETQANQNIKKIQHIAEISLRQILATYQYGKMELFQYARFQTLINEYLNHYFYDHICDTNFKQYFSLPLEILSAPLLWISAPEYFSSQNQQALKPGNFQRYLVDDFKKAVIKIHENFSSDKNINIFYHSQTHLNNFDLPPTVEVNVQLSSNDHDFYSSCQKLMLDKNTENFVFLGDFDPHQFQTIHDNAHGSYPITKKDIDDWYNNQSEFDGVNFIKDELDAKYDEFLNTLSFIEFENNFKKISETYSLNYIKLDENHLIKLFINFVLREKIQIGSSHLISKAPKVLSYLNSTKLPNKIISVSKPHNIVTQSLNVKILNHVFYILRQKGIDVEIPANETMYQLFWKNIIFKTQKIDFLITDQKDLDQFPSYLKVNHCSNLNAPLPSFKPIEFNNIEMNSIKNVSITQFEDYVTCPHKFLLKHILKIKRNINQKLLDFKEIGTITHKICEQLLTRLVILFGNDGYIIKIPEILESIISILSKENKSEEIFLNFDKNVWFNEIQLKLKKINCENLENIMLAFKESIELIWNNGEISFINLQQREILKRTFLKFLTTELENLKNNSTTKILKIGLYREMPVVFDFFGLKISGRIDRIDLTEDGLEIIDYKTSNISKSSKEIVLFPSIIKTNLKANLSVQGALYTYGFAKTNFTSDQIDGEDDIYLKKIKYYSLYFLKNLDENKNNYIKYNFEPAFEIQNLNYIKIEQEYGLYAKNLSQGQFKPNPIQESQTCLFCEFKSICPHSYRLTT